jgi:hypothetical protein
MGIETLALKLSGGASNTNPLLSYGGVISSTAVLSQTVSGATSIPGVTLVDGAGNAVTATGTLAYTASSRTLAWLEPGATLYGAPVNVNANGTYLIRGNGSSAGYVLVTVVSASLSSVTNYSSTVTIANRLNLVFDDVDKTAAYAGQTDYRCIYIKNDGAAAVAAVAVTLDVDTPGVDTLSVGKVAAAVNTTETAPADRFTAPSSVTFSGVGVAVAIGTIPSGQYWGFWIRRVVSAATVDGTVADTFRIKLTALV